MWIQRALLLVALSSISLILACGEEESFNINNTPGDESSLIGDEANVVDEGGESFGDKDAGPRIHEEDTVIPPSEGGGETGTEVGEETGIEEGGETTEEGGETGIEEGGETTEEGGETGIEEGGETTEEGGETGIEEGGETTEEGGETGIEEGGETTEEGGETTEEGGEEGEPANDSCEGICGEQAPSGCWCDPMCLEYEDCCDDYTTACPETEGGDESGDETGVEGGDPPLDSCDGFCGGQAPSGCWCDATCDSLGNCCEDYLDMCDETEGGDPPSGCQSSAECQDTNPCTQGVCQNGVCLFGPVPGACDDGDSCTDGDTCSNGNCIGSKKDCNDGNSCTTDLCVLGECEHVADLNDNECELKIEITSPERAEIVIGSGIVEVKGVVTSPAANVTEVILNGESIGVSWDGSFSVDYDAQPGVNILEAVATNETGQSAMTLQSFALVKETFAPGSPANVTLLNEKLGVWLDEQVFDDNQSDMDDLAVYVETIIEGFDLNDAIPDPLFAEGSEPSFGWCTWTVDLDDIDYTLSTVDVDPVEGGVMVHAVFTGISTYLSATAGGGCPDGAGTITSDFIIVDIPLSISVNNNQQLEVNAEVVNVIIDQIEVDIQSGFASLFDWVINWFEDDLTALIEDEMEALATQEITPILDGLLSEIVDYTTTIQIPELLPNSGGPMALTLSVQPSVAALSPIGAEFLLNVGMATNKGIAHWAPGSLGLGACAAPSASCLGKCGLYDIDWECQCDESCGTFGDCCSDKDLVCDAITTKPSGACCQEQGGTGCIDAACEQCVCDLDPFCCESLWDEFCAITAQDSCDYLCGCDTACCESAEDSGCEDDNTCEACVCKNDPYCCETQWDSICASSAADNCAISCGCADTAAVPETTTSPLPQTSTVEAFLAQDLVNQLFFSAWWGGLLNITLNEDQLGPYLAQFEGSGLSLELDPHMPPVFSTCTDDGSPELQMGDVLVKANYSFLGLDFTSEFFASIRVGVVLALAPGANGFNEFTFEVTDVKQSGAEMVSTSSNAALEELMVTVLLSEVMVELFMEEYLSGVVASIPIIQVDVGQWVPGIPSGTKMTLNPTSLSSDEGAMILGGYLLTL